MNPSNSASSTNTKGESTPPHSPITSKSSFPYVSAVGVDIGGYFINCKLTSGSFTKLVYWRPPAPPNLPSYIIKEFENGQPTLPLKPDPSLKVQLTGPGIAFISLYFFSYLHVDEMISLPYFYVSVLF